MVSVTRPASVGIGRRVMTLDAPVPRRGDHDAVTADGVTILTPAGGRPDVRTVSEKCQRRLKRFGMFPFPVAATRVTRQAARHGGAPVQVSVG